jgi:hypothetical protein
MNINIKVWEILRVVNTKVKSKFGVIKYREGYCAYCNTNITYQKDYLSQQIHYELGL